MTDRSLLRNLSDAESKEKSRPPNLIINNPQFLYAEALEKGSGNMKKIVDNAGVNIVILMYWSFLQQRIIVKQREVNPGNYIRFAFLPF